ELDVPPTILALLAARLDRLAQPERAVLEPAAVAGLTFPRAAVTELVADGDRPHVPDRLAAVERRRFIHAHSAVMGDPNSYQFEHILVRDAVYRRLLKRTRAQMHERFVAWADRVNGERAPEYAEITAYHLEQAHAYLADLGPLDAHGLDLDRRALRRLGRPRERRARPGVRRDHRLPPRAGPRLPGRPRPARRSRARAGPPRRRAAGGRRPARLRPRRHARGGRAPAPRRRPDAPARPRPARAAPRPRRGADGPRRVRRGRPGAGRRDRGRRDHRRSSPRRRGAAGPAARAALRRRAGVGPEGAARGRAVDPDLR